MYDKEPQNYSQELIVDEAKKLVGINSRNHPKDNEDHSLGCSPETGFDCSGFALYVLKKSGVNVSEEIRHASQLFDSFGILSHIPHKGDLVFFSRTGKCPTHVGIMINDKEYIHAPGKNGTKVEINNLDDENKEIPFTDESQLYIKNPIGFKRPVVSNGSRWKILL